MGYFVADTYLTQYEIDNLLVDFLHETSWTGFNHEDLERILNDLDESIKEEEEHKDDPNYYICKAIELQKLKNLLTNNDI